MKSKWITYKEKNIFYCDFTNMNIAQIQEEVDATDNEICRQPGNSVLVLSNMQGTPGNPQVVDIFKKSTSKTKPHVKKSAVLGVGYSGPRKILLDIVMKFSGQDVTLFDDEIIAKEWLVAE